MKKLLQILFFIFLFNTNLLAIEIGMVFNTHLKCEMIERTRYWDNKNYADETYTIKDLSEDENPLFISFDKNFVFYSWHKKKKIYELKDKIKKYNELEIVTEGHYNFDEYMNYQEWLKNPNLQLIENPGSIVFQINREEGKLVRYDIGSIKGAGTRDKFDCKKINYFSLPKDKVKTKF